MGLGVCVWGDDQQWLKPAGCWRSVGVRAGVIKGVDEVNAVLDEHITMTQAMQFSAFKVRGEAREEHGCHSIYIHP